MDIASNSQHSTASKSSAGAQVKDSTPSARLKLQGDADKIQQLSQANASETFGRNTQSTSNDRYKGKKNYKQQKPRPHEVYKQNQKVLQDLFTEKYFKKFFIISSLEGKNLAEINVITANKQLQATLKGSPTKVTELRDGTLLVEVANEKQSMLIKELKILNNVNVQVTEHASLNQIKGTIHYKNRPGYTEDELLSELNPQNVAALYNIRKRVSGVLERTPIYVVTFDACSLPKEVTIGWTTCSVREYIPLPRRCFKCNKYGHSSKTCRQEKGTCVQCGYENHGLQCNRTATCSNCGDAHPASAKDCFYYKLEKATVTLQTREKLSYSEAKRRATDNMVKPTETYAEIAKHSPKNTERNVNKPVPVRENSLKSQAETRNTTPQTKPNITSQMTQSTAPQLKPSTSLPKQQTNKNETSITNSISTVISTGTSEDRSKPTSNKRDGTAMGEAVTSDQARKRASYSHGVSGSTLSSDNFPTPSPILTSKRVPSGAPVEPGSKGAAMERRNPNSIDISSKSEGGLHPMDY